MSHLTQLCLHFICFGLTLTAADEPKQPAKGPIYHEALAEVNQVRAQRGLPPFVHDATLEKAAAYCATQRAAQLCSGHLPGQQSDFYYVYLVGADAKATGCAAWPPGWGWGSCCMYDRYTYAGAAWAMGRDGKRYMHLVVR